MTLVAPRKSAAPADMERVDAWYEYLANTQFVEGAAYAEVESWAWARLQTRLRIINRQPERP